MNGMKLYTDLAAWWPLLSSPADYEEEAEHHWRVLSTHSNRPIETMLELGCGGGNNAFHLKRRCRMTLSDLSPGILEVSRTLNPECEHITGDMRTLRLERTFDAVFVYDAVMYMNNERDLRAAMDTAYVHCRPGGVAIFVPDCTRETFEPSTDHGGHDGDQRSLRYLEWAWDPDPEDCQFDVEMVYLMKDRESLRVEHERHVLGLFPREFWLRLLTIAGFGAIYQRCPYAGGERAATFVGVRPE